MAFARKITLLGAGSFYFHTVIGELLATPELTDSQIMLFDPDERRMDFTFNIGEKLIPLRRKEIAGTQPKVYYLV